MNRKISLNLILVSLLVIPALLYAADSRYPSGLIMMKSGEVKPRGWILEQIRGDLRRGYVGNYDKLTPTAKVGLFGNNKADYKKPLPAGARKTWWAGEVEAHWMDGLIRMAFLTGDKEYQKIAERWVKDILVHQGADGYIGIYKPELRFNHKVENGELWTMSRAMLGMLAYAEYSHDTECLAAVKKAVALVMSTYDEEHSYFKPGKGGGLTHGMAFVDVLEWLYRISGDKQYVRFADFLYKDYNKYARSNTDFVMKNLLTGNRKFNDHGVHVAEQFMIPFFLASTTDEDSYQKAAANALEKFRFHHAPSGSINSVENVGGKQGTADSLREYCTFKSFTLSLSRVAMITGNPEVADWLETIVLNAAQGARTQPTLTAVQYCSSDNRVKINPKAYGGRLMYSACHGAAPCCAVSAIQLMPYFVEGMWMRRQSDELVAMQYGPCILNTSVNGTQVRITETTEYPFSDELTFTIDLEQATEFVLTFRKPGHVKEIEIADLPGAKISKSKNYIRILKKWAKDDVVRIRFKWDIRRVPQPNSETVQSEQGGIYLKRGPLVYALSFPYEWKAIHALGNTGYKNYGVVTKDSSGWDYSIDPDTTFSVKHDINADFLRPWGKSPLQLQGSLLTRAGKSVPVSLVPVGSTVLRRVTFPVMQ
jgi:hypothetical protein